MDRRQFLQHSKTTTLGLAAGTVLLGNAKSVRATPANDKVILAIVGCHGRGNMIAQAFTRRDDCEMAWLCDVDTNLFETRRKWLASCQDGKEPKCEPDFRRMLEDKSVDAVLIACPPHWHSLATIWCCQAGKDVYVEKPQSHNCWEGRQAVRAARKYERVVQVGFQNRSAPYLFAAKKYLDEGKIGKVHLCRVFNQKGEPNFPVEPDADPPAGLDWDMWNGPAPQCRYNPMLQKNWRHLWRYCGGDMTYDGIHQVDIARWLCGVTYPKTVYSSGVRYDRDGGAETPDTQISTFEFDDLTMTFEMSLFTPYMLKADQGIRDGDLFPHWPQNTERVELYGTEGMMVVGRMGSGWQVYVRPKSRQPVVADEMYGRFPDPPHQDNFIECVRSRQMPNADIEEGHLSTLLVHYSMLSCRMGGRKLSIDAESEGVVGDPEAMQFFRREGRPPWIVPGEV
ncbi:MAG: Gfo/Idh/MocA family oxidoreductase [Rhodopirellula sp.]|nr:Gfo/Idh/MocA family oxidoreductase [Rhodopirellula sp.]